jgi:HAE1 family hydrophobic/amphiphilic exporter-1
MAFCVIGGLITSTLLTLLVVPVVYTLLDGIAQRLTGKATVTAVTDEKMEPGQA